MFWIVGGTFILGRFFDWADTPIFDPLREQIGHSEWDGFTFYDLIFPMFLFIVGASLPFAVSRRVERGDDRGKLFLHILRRGATLVLLGLVVNSRLEFDFSDFRYLGVLQRIGIGYTVAATLMLFTGVRGQIAAFVGILLGYWGLMALVPVPGIGAGVLTPEGNLAGYIDRLLLPGRFCCYEHGDNEGVLSTIPAVATALLGVLSGHWLRGTASPERKAAGLAIGGLASLVVGGVWGIVFPINKLMWTSTYVLWAGGWSLLLLSFFYFVMDVKGYTKWAFPFVVIGMNAILIYLLNGLFDLEFIPIWLTTPLASVLGEFRDVVTAIGEFAIKWGLLYGLYRLGWFLKA